MSVARTVLGDISTNALRTVDSHDHLFFSSPALPGQELDSADLAEAEVRAYATAGGSTVVQWTPRALGRNRPALADISRRTGVHIISATGRHRAEHHDPMTASLGADELARAFVDDITTATHPCGVIKVGTGYHHLDHVERTSLEAAAAAHALTGAPVCVHLELGTAGDLALHQLLNAHVAPTSVILGHIGRNPDDAMLRDLASSGAYLCFDGPSRANHRTDWRTPECMEMLFNAGHGEQLLIGGDTTTATARSVVAGPGMPGLLQRFGRALQRRIGVAAYEMVTIANPARGFALAGH